MAAQHNFKVKNGLDVAQNVSIGGTLTIGGSTKSQLIDSALTNALITAGFAARDTDNLSEGSSNLYHTTARARGAISVTDAGGDGSLAYNSGTGVITYTGPSASEVRAHISAGTGVSVSSGAISIGQAVGTTDSVTFAGLTVSGDMLITGNTTTVNSSTLNIGDPLIQLADSNTSSNVVDIGFIGRYYDGTNINHTGLFRDASNSEYYLFATLVDSNFDSNVAPSTINRSDGTFGLSTLNVNSLKFSDATEQTSAAATPGFAIAMSIAL